MIKAISLILQTSLELGLIYGIVVLGLFLSYKMLNICDLSCEGSFALGACVAACFLLKGHTYLSIVLATLAGALAGIISGLLQTKLGINSLLSGIIITTGLYSINIAIMSGSPLVSLNNTTTIFTKAKTLLADTFLANQYKLLILLTFVIVIICFLHLFLKTKLGLTIRATGSNPDMVKNSSLNPQGAIIIALAIANSFTALAGALMASSQKAASVDLGSGVLTIALASLLIGSTLHDSGSIFSRASFGVVGAIIFRIIYALALRAKMPSYMLKLISAIIVILALSLTSLKKGGKKAHA